MALSDLSSMPRRPRLLVVTNLYPPVVVGGYEVECRDVVEHLRSTYEIDVLTSRDGRRRAAPRPDVHRILPRASENRFGVLLAPFHTWTGVRRVERFLEGRDYDLVFVWNAVGLPHLAISRLAEHIPRLAFRVCEQWFSGLYERDLFLRYLRPQDTRAGQWWSVLVRRAHRLWGFRAVGPRSQPAAVCWNSEFLRGTVAPPPAVEIVHEVVVHPVNAAADALTTLRREPPAGDPIVVFVGRVVEDKGIDTAIEALSELLRRHGVRARLRVIGNGPRTYLAALRRRAEAVGVADLVDLVGPRRGDTLRDELAAASAWVVPSRWEEPAPMVAIEASLARIPLVATRVGGIPELVRDGEEAVLFERDDALGCAAALAEVLQGGRSVADRSTRAFRRAQGLSFGPYLRRVEGFIETALASPPAEERTDRPSRAATAEG
ncbi:glycosyltransferase involved in cell wall biosynthesis [Actinomycetospora succinea]|uniref:Glycosyltransferase involved in cell wall biosynthesis n=1 Tax=Actinomycetospora succinea TaxID=663603 RepID=A0A4R6UU19_9PSEU|nr:glycosyltransferase family 4 protein [Actinomycetospora succinea]TDQ48865.1 glycosyltransferase involved in cell wall biosynthesis [Actinomycetospora succinea]